MKDRCGRGGDFKIHDRGNQLAVVQMLLCQSRVFPKKLCLRLRPILFLKKLTVGFEADALASRFREMNLVDAMLA